MAYNDIAFYHLVRLCFLLVFHDCPNNVCYVMKPSVTNTSIKDCKVTYFFTLFYPVSQGSCTVFGPVIRRRLVACGCLLAQTDQQA